RSLSDVVSGTGVVERLRAAGCVFAEEEAEMLLAAAAGPADLDRVPGTESERLGIDDGLAELLATTVIADELWLRDPWPSDESQDGEL
ncbi:hypothetical protein ACWCQ0_47240, partial [Streptomyces massasporeus]